MAQPLSIAFIWHMHQPYYRDLASGSCSMPWVRLHATKDYLDMLKRLELFPSLHQTFNLVPSLLDQLEDYLSPANLSDDFLDLSRKPAEALSEQDKRFILRWFFSANWERMVRPFPRYHDLLSKRGSPVKEGEWAKVQKRFHVQDYRDLQVWFNLTWIDPWLRSQNQGLSALEAKGAHFSEEEKRCVLDAHLSLIAQVIPAYRKAADSGQVELAISPYYHPILPLLCDTRAASMALPHMALPREAFRYPEDARWQMEQGLQRAESALGRRPVGVWPPEGSVSEEVVRIVCESNIRWIATDEEILWRTLKTARSASALYRPHLLRRKMGQSAIVFRDRELSDLVGFVYSQWDPKIAVADFMKRLERIYEQFAHAAEPALVSIILDGENAWEFYPQDGHEFLMGLYQALSQDQRFRCVTVSEFLERYPLERSGSLPDLFSGSWIDANFATWIGHPEKNLAWEHLARAREALRGVSREDSKTAQAWKSFGAAEGSDWMWWFGDTHYSAHAEEFDRLFRLHLTNSYQLAGLPSPSELQGSIRRQVVQPLYEPTGLIHPTIDGRESSYYEWLYAGRIDLQSQYTAMQRSEQCLRQLRYGFDGTHQYLRLDLDRAALSRLTDWAIDLSFAGAEVRIASEEGAVRAHALSPSRAPLACAFDRLLELAIPLDLLSLKAGERASLIVRLKQGTELLEQYPIQGTFELSVSALDLEAQAWPV